MERELDAGGFVKKEIPTDIADVPTGKSKAELELELETLKKQVQELKKLEGMTNE